MKDKYLAVKISFPESDFAGATIYLEDWQAERLKAGWMQITGVCGPLDFQRITPWHMPSTLRLRCILEAWKEKNPRKRQLTGDPGN